MTRTDWTSEWRVDLPEGECGDLRVEKFTIQPNDPGAVHYALKGRPIPPGTYTRLMRGRQLWMSDTQQEAIDHMEVRRQIQAAGGRILIVGLGLGMIVKQALACPAVTHVDVVEIDEDVVKLVGPSYSGPRCTIHHADAYQITWPRGTHWTVAWFDIWPDLCADNLPQMARLARSYGRRADWKGYWGKEETQAHIRSYGW